MKLAEMSVKSTRKINKVMESRFGFAINFSNLTVEKAEKLSETIAANLNKIRHSVALHTAETNPRYMELLTVQEGLTTWLEQNRTQLNEGEVGNAEVLLAAKDMVDSVQDAIEKVGKMQNEQLPQLLDSIRDQIGSEQAEAFKNAVGTTLDTLMQNLQSAREGVDNGVRVLSGEQLDNPMAMPGDTAGADLSGGDAGLPPAPGSDLDQDETDGFSATDAAVGGAEELGREQR
jgi:uncharacterized protein YicC (UPF0701 family)